MQDAQYAHPVCGDIYARVFMNETGLQIFKAFREERKADTSTIVRHRIIDDFLRQALSVHSDLCVVIIGAGFDSRAYRLAGGIWVELDEPQVITRKNEQLPAADCVNELHRIPIHFSRDSLVDKLSSFSGRNPVVVVVEGVFMYLEQNAISLLLRTLRQIFPQHQLICDLMTRQFFEKYSRRFHETIKAMGTSFKTVVDRPEEIFIKNGYHRTETISIVGRTVEFGKIRVPRLILKRFLRFLAKGYLVYVFTSE
jgi:methyltransferase (TIGR00027 family)